MRDTFLRTLLEEAKGDDRIWLLTADFGFSVLEPFEEAFPERYINVGIAEQNAIGIAAGLALRGKIPYVYTAVPFATSRPYEQIKVDCAYMNTNVRIVGVGSGFSYGPAGATHHALDDIAIMRTLPNMAVLAPGGVNEVEALTSYSVNHRGPLYMRLGRRGEPRFENSVEFGRLSKLFEGEDFAIIATSSMLSDAYNAALEYRKLGACPALFSAHTLKPFDDEAVLDLVDRKIPIVSVEEHNIIGGLFSAISEVVAKSGKAAKILPIAVRDEFSHCVGSQKYIKDHLGLGNLKEQIDAFL